MRVRDLCLCLLLSLPLGAETEKTNIPVGDSFRLPAQFDLPTDKPRGVIILVHGSGSHSRDEELGELASPKVENPFFARLSNAFVKQDFAVLRYDKRNYALTEAEKNDSKEPAYKEMVENPARAFVADTLSAISVARTRFPGVPLYLLGHSEGCWVSLQAARKDSKVAGCIEISYPATNLDNLVQEQVVYRPLGLFRRLDKDGSGALERNEQIPELKAQMPVLDLDQDGLLSEMEFQAGNWSNMVRKPLIPDAWRQGEAAYPTANSIVGEADFKILFLQGLWDNQCPAYGVKALEIVEKNVWKKGNKRFVYFPKAGHALDPRKTWDDLLYTRTPEAAIEQCATEAADFFAPKKASTVIIKSDPEPPVGPPPSNFP